MRIRKIPQADISIPKQTVTLFNIDLKTLSQTYCIVEAGRHAYDVQKT